MQGRIYAIENLIEQFNDILDMVTTRHYYAGILTDSEEILVDESGNEILGEWTVKEV